MINVLESEQISSKQFCQQRQIDIIRSDIIDWEVGKPLPIPVIDGQAAIIKNRIYLFGGYNNSGKLPIVLTAPIDENGILGQWTTSSPLPVAISNGQVITVKNRVYLIGGISADSCSNYISDVYMAPISKDGTIGEWIKGNPFPIRIAHSKAIVIKDKVYMFGGYNDDKGYLSTVFTATINKNGTLGQWVLSDLLPVKTINSQVIVFKYRIYLLGGKDRNGGISTVFTAPIYEDGSLGQWTVDCQLPAQLVYSQAAVVINNKIYLFGGYNKEINNYKSTISAIFTATIGDDGILDQWTISPSTPKPIYDSQAVFVKNKLYLLGGRTGTDYLSTVYIASIK